jgi:Spy/CpxP family protein refolding chaperone
MSEYIYINTEKKMKKLVSIALILGTTALMACPMGQGCNGSMGGGMMGNGASCGLMEKCQCDTKVLPRSLEALDLSDQQKEQIIKLREEGQAFHNKQREKIMAVLTAEQKGKLEYARKLKELRGGGKGLQLPQGGGMGCKQCPNK